MAKRKKSKSSQSLWPRVGAVAAGFFAVALLSVGTDEVLHLTGVYPPWGQMPSDNLLALATGYRVVYTVFGGFLTARLSPSSPMKLVWILAYIGLALSLPGVVITLTHPEMGPLWYPLTLVVTSLPCVWLGGKWALMGRG